MTWQDRFWEKVERRGPDECWPWKGTISRLGYGHFKLDNAQASAHRIAYTLTVGAIPGGLELDHTCSNRWCQNPAHLEPVTHAENVRRGAERSTHCRSGRHPWTPENIIMQHGYRSCLACKRERDRVNARRYRARRATA